jgi:hypothetical protein
LIRAGAGSDELCEGLLFPVGGDLAFDEAFVGFSVFDVADRKA